ncbi:esterase FE4 [Trichonephila clavipes]|nr:esterase FE4 [Trichonephila clavipes]
MSAAITVTVKQMVPVNSHCHANWCGWIPVAAVAEWYRYRIVACLVTSSSPLPRESDFWSNENDLNYHEPIYCPQVSSSYISDPHDGVIGQEDCLFLDVHVRKVEAQESLPVLIYFHPGRFSFGSKEEYGGDFLLKYNEMILVVPNYRLGILGFLSNKDSVFPGNLGLWDQRMAMKWVNENILLFGGDPQRITIAGHDAGGASVGFHILSPLSHTTGTRVSRVTVSKRLHERGLFARRPAVCVPLTSTNRRVRLAWFRQHRDWSMDQWVTVLFTDESRFSLNINSRRTSIWREPGTRYLPCKVHEFDNYGGGDLMAWTDIMLDGCTPLHVFKRGSVTGVRYRDVVLELHVCLFRSTCDPEFILMDDNARPHRALLVDEFLESEDIRRMD